MARLNGKPAIITGAGSGIGRASARLFAAEDARVAILDRNGNAARDVEQELRRKGQEAISLPNSISPGFVRTAMSVVNGADETTTERFMNHYVKLGRIPLRRAGLPEESLRRHCFSRQGNAVT